MLDKRNMPPRARSESFANLVGIEVPILLAPMAGACPPSLSVAVANAGGLGACGALMMKPDEIEAWCSQFRKDSRGEFQINLWIPEASPKRDFDLEKQQREFLANWGPVFHQKRAMPRCRTLKRSAISFCPWPRKSFLRSWGFIRRRSYLN